MIPLGTSQPAEIGEVDGGHVIVTGNIVEREAVVISLSISSSQLSDCQPATERFTADTDRTADAVSLTAYECTTVRQ